MQCKKKNGRRLTKAFCEVIIVLIMGVPAMPWSAEEVQQLRALAGVYRLPKGCWAVLTVKDGAVPEELLEACPEGVEYSWAVLMPGVPPVLRGERMAGVDNADDASVRRKAQGALGSPRHRAHRHWPDWSRTREIAGEEWPLAGQGAQLPAAAGTVAELWRQFMESLEDLFSDIGVPVPSESELVQSLMAETDFRRMQQMIRQRGPAGSAPGR